MRSDNKKNYNIDVKKDIEVRKLSGLLFEKKKLIENRTIR